MSSSPGRRIHPVPDPVGPGQESVWDFPRPPRLEPNTGLLRVESSGVTIAETRAGFRVLETSHPPTYYLPPDECTHVVPSRVAGSSHCEWKGRAMYWDVVVDGRTFERVAWSYPDPTPAFREMRDHLAFYPGELHCSVDGERALPQPGGFYGGWVTSGVVGPFKGGAGTGHW